ncbi:MAG: BatD family protein [Myxococcales bacterium]|nr:BatD family protein [Myxococcales bacterium]
MVALLWSMAASWATQVQLRVEPDRLVAGQTGRARVLVVSGQQGDARANPSRPPVLPSEQGVQVDFHGQMQQFQNLNGRIRQIHTFDYRVAALEEGTWSVGPVEIPLRDGSVARTEAISVVVVPRDQQQAERSEVDVTASFEAEEAWEGEVILYRYRFETTIAGATAEWELPAFEGLRPATSGPATQSQYTVDDPDGAITIQEGVQPLIATGTGRRDHGVAIAHVRIPIGRADPFGFRRHRRDPWVSRPSAVLTIKPLPPAPPGFSGLVGDFQVESAVDRSEAAVGQSVAWSLRIVGDGALEGFALPAYEATGASVYEDASRVSGRVQGEEYVSVASFRRVVVPTEEGQLVLPPFELVTFSPTSGKYETHTVQFAPIRVTPGREGDGEVTSFAGPAPEFDPDAMDALAPRPVLTSGAATAWSVSLWLPLLLLGAAAPGLSILLTQASTWGTERMRAWEEARRAPPTMSDRLASLPEHGERRWAALDGLLRSAMADDPQDDTLPPLLDRLQRLRFAEGEADEHLEQDIRRALRGRGGSA